MRAKPEAKLSQRALVLVEGRWSDAGKEQVREGRRGSGVGEGGEFGQCRGESNAVNVEGGRWGWYWSTCGWGWKETTDVWVRSVGTALRGCSRGDSRARRFSGRKG
jgi:hypothetical protein